MVHADVCVVGAGILGLAHAFEARRRGLSVVLLERDGHAVGASVNNFGHLFAGSQPDGPLLELALAARERWLELAAAAELAIVREGTLIIARAADELAVLEQAAANPLRQALMLSAEQALARVPLARAGVLGALHSRLDLRVDPRTAVARLAALLSRDAGVTLLWRTHVHAVEPGRVDAMTAAGSELCGVRVEAAAIVVCPGHDYDRLAPELRSGLTDLTRCRLQMLRVAAPAGRCYGPALATGLSLIRYPAFAAQAPAAGLAARLARERPELIAEGIHLLVTQRPDGDLIIGDSHRYGDTLDVFADERIDALLLAEAAALLGVPQLAVRERWLGTYTTRAATPETYAPFAVSRPMPTVRVVENVAGIGMTLAPGFAPVVLDELTADRPQEAADAAGS